MCKNSSRGPRMLTISTEAGTVTRRSSSRPLSPPRWPDAFRNELGEAGDSRWRALDPSGALAVNSDLLSWFLAVGRKCQHPILGHSPRDPQRIARRRAEEERGD